MNATAPATHSATDPPAAGVARYRAGTGRPPWQLSGSAVLVAALFALPGGYVVWRALTGGALHLLVERRALEPLWRTVQLAVLVSASAAVLGTGLAWLTVRTDLPLRRLWRVLAPLPLVYPSFVGAAAFRSGLTPGGIVHDLAGHLGIDLQLRLHGLVGAWLVLTLFTYPYVYLPVAARLAGLPSSLEENARLLGDRPLRVFRRVVLPQASSSIAAGALLVFLYTVSDFGAVHLMRFETLTQTIYRNRLFDQGRAFALALLLLALALLVVAAERSVARRGARAEAAGGRSTLCVGLGRWTAPALAGCTLVIGLALVAPAVSLADWGLFGWFRQRRGLAALRLDWGDVAAEADRRDATLAAEVDFQPENATFPFGVHASVVEVDAVVVAISLIFWTLHAAPFEFLIGSMPVLVFAYVVHFGAQAVRTAQVAVAAVPRRMDDAARLLGAGRIRRLFTVDLPIMAPGLAAGAGLVMLSTMKELPATLLVAPIGFRTLVVEIWDNYEALYLAEMGILALVLVAISAMLTWFLVVRRADHLA